MYTLCPCLAALTPPVMPCMPKHVLCIGHHEEICGAASLQPSVWQMESILLTLGQALLDLQLRDHKSDGISGLGFARQRPPRAYPKP